VRPIRFDIVGGGFRTQAFLQIAHAMPDRFQVGGMFVRDETKGQAFEEKWHVKTYRTLVELLEASERDFMLVSLPRSVTPVFIRELVELGVPVLTETPPTQDLESLLDLYAFAKKRHAKIQVAEQYHFQPLNAARIALAHSGKLGTVSQAQVSVAHDYHGMNLMRKLLGIQFENATITAHEFVSPLTAGPTRAGLPTEDKTFPSKQVIAYLDFGDKLGIYDFCNEQYRSWIRSAHVLVRGDRGEINNTQVCYLEDILTPIQYEFARQDASKIGNLEGLFHRGYMAGGEWIYRNPFIPGRLTDDEIAISTCLDKMAQYVKGGPDFYSLEDASQDHYLQLMIQQALATKQPVQTSTQPWAFAQ
jgi:predicted dehydrogenase